MAMAWATPPPPASANRQRRLAEAGGGDFARGLPLVAVSCDPAGASPDGNQDRRAYNELGLTPNA